MYSSVDMVDKRRERELEWSTDSDSVKYSSLSRVLAAQNTYWFIIWIM